MNTVYSMASPDDNRDHLPLFVVASAKAPAVSASRARREQPITTPIANKVTGLDQAPPVKEKCIEFQLYDNLASSKVAIAKVSMHLPVAMRQRIFSELDRLLNIEDWDDDCSFVNVESIHTFMRTVIYNSIKKIKSLGISDGNLLASWRSADSTQRIYAEFMPSDIVKVTGVSKSSDSNRSFSTIVKAGDLSYFLQEKGVKTEIVYG
jgi:hypothetical protein